MSRHDDERRANAAEILRIDAAFRAGDLAALRAAVADPSAVPNGAMPLAIGSCLEYAIYHSPLAFIRTLLEAGAAPNPADHTGFPPLLAAVLAGQKVPGHPGRPDTHAIVDLLLAFGADPNIRGMNDETPLHVAVTLDDLPIVRALLAAGADPHLPTRIDDQLTPLDLARAKKLDAMMALLEGR
jgi:ankyrin repeat protein